jgi:hypothetical protein
MKKFILMLIASIIFVNCSPTEVKIHSPNGIETASLEDFFDFETIVISTNGYLQIIMDKNTEVLYIMSYHYGISPIYDSDGTIMTKEKWLAKRAKRKD